VNAQHVLTIGQQALYIMVLLSAPLLITALAVGLVISVLQAATQINEMTLSFLPKLLAIGLAICAALLAARALWRRDRRPAPPLGAHLRPLGIPAIGAGYVVLAPIVGYQAAVAALIAAAIFYFGARAPAAIAASAVLGATALWLVFAKALGVAMPAAGILRWFA